MSVCGMFAVVIFTSCLLHVGRPAPMEGFSDVSDSENWLEDQMIYLDKVQSVNDVHSITVEPSDVLKLLCAFPENLTAETQTINYVAVVLNNREALAHVYREQTVVKNPRYDMVVDVEKQGGHLHGLKMALYPPLSGGVYECFIQYKTKVERAFSHLINIHLREPKIDRLERKMGQMLQEMSNTSALLRESQSGLERQMAEMRYRLLQLERLQRCEPSCGALAALDRTKSLTSDMPLTIGCGKLEMNVICDMVTDGGGWVVFQRRLNGDVRFDRSWEEYKHGFGSTDGDFWLGLENIYMLMRGRPHELYLDIVYYQRSSYAHYSNFSIGNEKDKYRLFVSGFRGTERDGLKYDNAMQFSTYDSDNDISGENCAALYGGGWWYRGCSFIVLNTSPTHIQTIENNIPKETRMMMRPV